MLVLSHISKSYPTPQGPLPILDDISLTLDRGEAAAITGPSGSGKSSLLYILGALEPPSSGTVTLDGRNPHELGDHDAAAFRNRHIGFVFQDHSLLPQCTVVENVLAPTLVARNGSPREFLDRARTLLDGVGLAQRLDHRPAQLSGGEKQRVAIARALVCQPTLLLCDEPTGNLDQRNADTVADLLLSLHQSQSTVLIVVTHNADLAKRFPRRLVLTDGHLVKCPS